MSSDVLDDFGTDASLALSPLDNPFRRAQVAFAPVAYVPVAYAQVAYAPVDVVGAAMRLHLVDKPESFDDEVVIPAGQELGDLDNAGDAYEASDAYEGNDTYESNDSYEGSDADEASDADEGCVRVGIPRDKDIFLGSRPDRLHRAMWRANKFVGG